MVVIEDAEDDEIWEMTYRLRYGTTLRAQEVRDAQVGPLRDFVKDLARHRMFAKYAAFSNLHLAHEHVAAQITLMELKGGLTGIDDPPTFCLAIKSNNKEFMLARNSIWDFEVPVPSNIKSGNACPTPLFGRIEAIIVLSLVAFVISRHPISHLGLRFSMTWLIFDNNLSAESNP